MASLEQTRNRYPAIIKRPSSTTIRRDKSLYSCGATLIGANPSRPLMHTNICGILITEILLRLTYLVTCSARPQKPIQNTILTAIPPPAALLKESRHSYYFFLTGLSLTISFDLEIVNIYSSFRVTMCPNQRQTDKRKKPVNPSFSLNPRALKRPFSYLFENWGARRADLRPYFLRSFMRGSLVR